MSAMVNPAMITLARQARGLNQTQLSAATGLSQGFISKAENGVVEVTPERLEKIAAALRFPVDFFAQVDRTAGPVCLHHRKRQTMPVMRLHSIHAEVNIARLQSLKLLHGVEIQAAYEFPHMDIDEYSSVEEVAQLARAHWGLPMGPIDNVVSVIERAGGIVFMNTVGTDKFDAISLWMDGRPFFYVNADIPGDRLRWTLSHEIGHMIMHSRPTPDQEREADLFAAEFLMPAREIRPELANLSLPKLAALKERWKVSMQALIRRAHRLGQITDRQQKSYFMRFSQLGYRKREPVEVPLEVPMLIQKIIEIHRKDHGYSVGDLSRAVHMLEPEFLERFLPGEPQPRLRVVT
jgi:Zn-dependent peptidase ImmA (M78 family)/transcriptional regulator with XRE-family HTH domain